jgi:protein TonB
MTSRRDRWLLAISLALHAAITVVAARVDPPPHARDAIPDASPVEVTIARAPESTTSEPARPEPARAPRRLAARSPSVGPREPAPSPASKPRASPTSTSPAPQVEPSRAADDPLATASTGEASPARVGPVGAPAFAGGAGDYLRLVRDRVARAARLDRGKLVLRLVVARDGRVLDVAIARGGSAPQSEEARLRVAALGRLPPIPRELAGSGSVAIRVPLRGER